MIQYCCVYYSYCIEIHGVNLPYVFSRGPLFLFKEWIISSKDQSLKKKCIFNCLMKPNSTFLSSMTQFTELHAQPSIRSRLFLDYSWLPWTEPRQQHGNNGRLKQAAEKILSMFWWKSTSFFLSSKPILDLHSCP